MEKKLDSQLLCNAKGHLVGKKNIHVIKSVVNSLLPH